MTAPFLSPVPNPDIIPGQLLNKTWQAWFRQLYTFVTATSGGGGGIVPATRVIGTTAPLSGGGDLSADRTHSILLNGITNSLLAQMPGLTIKGNNSALAGNAADLTAAQTKVVLSLDLVENTALSTWPGTTNLVTLGTVTTGTWHGSTITAPFGGTGQATYVIGDLLYASATNALSRLAGNITTTKNFLTQTGSGAASAAPVWGAISTADVPAAGSTKQIQFNLAGAFSADSRLTYDPATGDLAIGAPSSGDAVTITNVAGANALAVNGNSAGTAVVRLNTQATTGAQVATFAATNKPGSGTTSPDTWVPINLDGTVHYIPAWL